MKLLIQPPHDLPTNKLPNRASQQIARNFPANLAGPSSLRGLSWIWRTSAALAGMAQAINGR